MTRVYFLLLLSGCQAVADIHERTLEDGGSAIALSAQSAECTAYCDSAIACPDDTRPYAEANICQAVCPYISKWSPEKKAANNTDTLECRMSALKNATEHDCDVGGPSGGGVCGDRCEAYCLLRQQVCDSNYDTCMSGCPMLRNSKQIISAKLAFQGGDTLQCRLSHVSSAAFSKMTGDNDKKNMHCRHSDLNVLHHLAEGPQLCVEKPNCDQYCDLMQSMCGAQRPYGQYDDEGQCQAVCAAIDPGQVEDQQNVDTLGCRIFRAYMTLSDKPELACTQAGPVGGGTAGCGDNCSSYCTLLSKACTEDFNTQFGTLAACQRECMRIDTGEPYSKANRAKALPCRIYSATRAIDPQNKALQADYCKKAVGMSACP